LILPRFVGGKRISPHTRWKGASIRQNGRCRGANRNQTMSSSSKALLPRCLKAPKSVPREKSLTRELNRYIIIAASNVESRRGREIFVHPRSKTALIPHPTRVSAIGHPSLKRKNPPQSTVARSTSLFYFIYIFCAAVGGEFGFDFVIITAIPSLPGRSSAPPYRRIIAYLGFTPPCPPKHPLSSHPRLPVHSRCFISSIGFPLPDRRD
jgi:hypothetical protein